MLDRIGEFIPFLAPYPGWVKAIFAIVVLSLAALVIALVVAAPTRTGLSTNDSNKKGEPSAWLIIRGVDLYGGATGRGALRVTAHVNGTRYVYPSIGGINWLEAGPDMAPQTFQLPLRDRYIIRFEAQFRDGTRLVSVEEHVVDGQTAGIDRYALHDFDADEQSRAPSTSSEIRYEIVRR